MSMNRRGVLEWAVTLAALFCALCPSAQSPPEQKQLTVYAAQTSYSLPVLTREGKEFVGLLEVLEPLGTVSANPEGRKWKLHFNHLDAQFSLGKTKAKAGRAEIDLAAPFFTENSRGYVPLENLPAVLAGLLPSRPLQLHAAGRRLILDKTEVHFASVLKTGEVKTGAPSQLVVSFSAPVNPSIATEPGRLRMVFRREPLVGEHGQEIQSWPDKTITALNYGEANGYVELAVSSPYPLTAFFSSDRKTITVLPEAPPPSSQAKPGTPVSATGANGGKSAGKPGNGMELPSAREFLVVIDAAHGGADRGGAITDQLAEKDVALAFARRLQNELRNRGIAVRLLRDGDATLTPEQRAAAANAAVPSLYVAIHAAGSGSGVHLFTSNIAPAAKPAVFLPWETAQAGFVQTSGQVADTIVNELLKHDIAAFKLNVPVAPLNRIAAPALAIEVTAPSGKVVEDIASGAYQQSLCSSIATGIANLRSRLPHGQVAP